MSAIQSFGRRLEAEGRSPKTVSAYLRDLSYMADALIIRHPRTALDGITSAMIDEALTSPEIMQSARGSARSRASMHRFKAAVRSFFSWAEQNRIIRENPAASFRLHRLPRSLPRFLTETEKRRLLKELRCRSTDQDTESRSVAAARDRVVIELFLGTGIRLQELVNLDIEDIDLDAKHLFVCAKGGVQQVKFLKTTLRSLLRTYLAVRRRRGDGECRALFLSNRDERLCGRQVARRLQYWLSAAGIDKKLSPHALRHTFATHLYSRTGDILVVQRALGHRDVSTTLVYTHLVDGALEEALERL
ncbi:MAG: tyrosine-type recombinase/integrase [candidate division Zixibacteria bacterium]|nr:tyrosine-type recombinase/integrase [candidate division Zixibacteria bacterium]